MPIVRNCKGDSTGRKGKNTKDIHIDMFLEMVDFDVCEAA